jgi:hypothetical protein
MRFHLLKFGRSKPRTSENGAVQTTSSRNPIGYTKNLVTNRPISNHGITNTELSTDGPTQIDRVRVADGTFPSESNFSLTLTSLESPPPKPLPSSGFVDNESSNVPKSPETKDSPSSEVMKWAVRCKVGLELLEKALAGVPVPGLKAAAGSVALIIDKIQVSFSIFHTGIH